MASLPRRRHHAGLSLVELLVVIVFAAMVPMFILNVQALRCAPWRSTLPETRTLHALVVQSTTSVVTKFLKAAP
jgi:hypothetical protein